MLVVPAQADDLTLICCTYHNDTEAGFNNFNPGLIYRHEVLKDTYILAGGYYNSERNPSGMLGVSGDFDLNDTVTASLHVGGVTGYQKYRVLPFVIPTLVLGDRVGVSFLPTYHNQKLDWAANLTIKLTEW